MPSHYVVQVVLDEPFSAAVERRLREVVPDALRTSESGATGLLVGEPRDLRYPLFGGLTD